MPISPADRAFLETLLTSPGPSGYEEPIQRVVRAEAEGYADDVSTDTHGNVTVAVRPEGRPRVMLAGHCDQIGLVVKHIDENGFLRVGAVGGWDVQTLLGQAMQVWTASGAVPGVIARKAIHLLDDKERKQVPDVKDLWVDIGASDRGDAGEVVAIGDPVTLKLGPREMRGGFLSGPAMDDRVGVWVVTRAARRAVAYGGSAGVFAVSTVQEEIGLRGAKTSAYRIDPDVAIAVDVTHATDTPTVDANELGDIRLGGGPVVFRGPNVNPVVFTRLCDVAGEHDIPIQVAALNRPASNDANALQLSRGGPATAVIGIPNRYMHSPVEMVSPEDLDAAAELLARFCARLDGESDWTPR